MDFCEHHLKWQNNHQHDCEHSRKEEEENVRLICLNKFTICVLCVSFCRCCFVGVRHSIFCVCVTCCDLDVTISLSGTAREKARVNNNDLSYVPSLILILMVTLTWAMFWHTTTQTQKHPKEKKK